MSNTFFIVYVFALIFFGAGQFTQMLLSTQGVILSMFIANCLFVIYMTYKAYKICDKNYDSNSIKVLFIYSLGIVIYASLSILLFRQNMENSWQEYDTLNVIMIFSLFIVLGIFTGRDNLKIISGAVVKGIPQTTFAVSIWFEGNLGVSMEMIIAFHILTLPRCYQTYKIWKSHKSDKNKKAMFISEAVNEFTWTIVTIAFFSSGKSEDKSSLFFIVSLIPYIFPNPF
ncbi:MAG: hypothetical protein PHS49_04575 [Candidatus Gracilibacteria bacterium]|nr:hypothetical protein [Candidatus Gracilibacteria bacterium]